MKMDWLRLWHEMPIDPKWRVVSRRSGRPASEIIAVYTMMLVNASQSEERGTLENWDDEDVAAALDMETEHVLAIREAMQGKVLDGQHLAGWEKRQPSREDEGRYERVKRHREKAASENPENNPETPDEPLKRDETDDDIVKRDETHGNALKRTETPRNALKRDETTDKIRLEKRRKDQEHIIPAQEREQDKPIALIDQQYIPLFRQIASVFHEEDLPPTSKRINTLKKAMKLNHVGGFDRILEAASNLASSLSPPGMKRYDWLLHGFDFEEHITEFLTRKNNGKPKPRKYAAVPDDWRPEDAVVATTQ